MVFELLLEMVGGAGLEWIFIMGSKWKHWQLKDSIQEFYILVSFMEINSYSYAYYLLWELLKGYSETVLLKSISETVTTIFIAGGTIWGSFTFIGQHMHN